MLSANQIKNGAVIEINGAPCVVENVVKQTPSARGASTIYKVRARNLLDRTKTDLTCRGDDSFVVPDFQTRDVQFLYRNGDTCCFMDLESYDQYELHCALIEEELPYLVEEMEEIVALLLEDRVIGIRLPDVVQQKLVECDPAIKGASATARTKPATTETGLILQVPEYMQNGELVRVDTRTGKFLGRA